MRMRTWSVLALTVWAGAGLSQAKELQLLSNGIRVEPVRIAQARLVDGQAWIVGEWMNYAGGSNIAAPGAEAFDAFEPDDAGAPTGGVACGLSGEGFRWFFEEGYCNGAATADMSVEPGFEGAESTTNNYAWNWECAGQAEASCVVAVFTGEAWGACDGFDDAYDGVAYDFGVQPCNPGGYYYTNVDLEGSGLFHQLPLGGTGWYQVLYLSHDGQGLVPADCAQPMLWGAAEGRPGDHGPNQWDDDDPRDGAYQENECYDYAYGLCPDPLHAMQSFGGQGGDDCDENANCTGDERIRKAKCCVEQGVVKTVTVQLSGAVDGIVYTVELDSGQCADTKPAINGKAKAVFKGNNVPPPGPNGANACGSFKAFNCDDICDGDRPEGACCIEGQACQVLTENECDAAGGAYYGNNTTCDPDPCMRVIRLCSGVDENNHVPLLPGAADTNITQINIAQTCQGGGGAGFPVVFDNAPGGHFDQAQAGPPAFCVANRWGEANCLGAARWINYTHTNGQSFPPGSVLYAMPFHVSTPTVPSARLTFEWRVDDVLADQPGVTCPPNPNPVGVYINGMPAAATFSGGGFGPTCSVVTDSDIGPLLIGNSQNWLYVYQRDSARVLSGVIFCATITLRDCDGASLYVRCKRNGTLVAKVKSLYGEGTVLTLTDNGGDPKTVILDENGKGRAKWRNRTPGLHTVAIVECPNVSKTVECYRP